MKRSIRKTWEEIHRNDMKDEERVVKYLQKKGFKVPDWHHKKPSNKPYDILATKNKQRWVVEVKGGKNPPVKLENFMKMLNKKNIDMVGLALVIDRHPFLLSYKRYTYLAEKAWIKIRKKNVKKG